MGTLLLMHTVDPVVSRALKPHAVFIFYRVQPLTLITKENRPAEIAIRATERFRGLVLGRVFSFPHAAQTSKTSLDFCDLFPGDFR